MTKTSLSRVLAVVMTLGVGAAFASYDASPAFAQNTKATEKAAKAAKGDLAKDKAAKSQSDKKPAQSCDGMDKATKAYSDCVKAQAQTTQDKRKGDQAAKKAAATDKKAQGAAKKTTTQ